MSNTENSAAARADNSIAEPAPASAAPRTAPSILRHSLFRYSPALILVAIMIADSSRYADPDLWGHLRFGLDFVALGHLVRHDPYSYSAPGHLWRDHEWLCEVLMALFYKGLGVFGLKLMRLICTAVTIIFMALAMSETGASTLAQIAILLGTAVAIEPQVQYRPQMFTFALLSVLLALLARHRYRGRAPLWIAVPLLALWANLHGGFIMGIAALGIYAGVVLLEDLYLGAGWRRGARLIGLAIAAAIATLANPYGIGMWATIARALRNPWTHRMVIDWQTFYWSAVHQWSVGHAGMIYYALALGLMVGLAVAFIRAPKGGDLPLVAIAAVMVASAFVSIRNLPIALIACSIPLARHLALLFRPAAAGAAPERSPLLSQAIVTALAVLLAVETGFFSQRLPDDNPQPSGAVAFMKEHRLHGNVLCDFDWGEYLIWHIEPESKVFIDGRYDTAYPPKVIQRFVGFWYGLKDASRIFTGYHNDFALVTPKSGAYRVMARRKDWRLIYRDKTCALFAPSDSPAAAIPAIPVTGHPGVRYFPD